MKRNLLFFLLVILITSSIAFSYETTKATKITSNPLEYEGKQVLVYIKFGKITQEGIFSDFLVKGIEYHYDIEDKKIVDILDESKKRDYLTLKGEVKIEGFIPYVEIHGLVKGWIDTTLLPECPEEIEITCPNCNETIIYDVTKKTAKLKE